MIFVPTSMPSKAGRIILAGFKSESDKTWVSRVLERADRYWYQAVDPAGGWSLPEELPVREYYAMLTYITLKYT